MIRKNIWFVLVLSFFCAFVVPEKKAEAFIFRAAARVVGAAIGLAAGVAVGAARVVAGTVALAAAGVARVAVGAFRVGRFLLFGRPWAPLYSGYHYGYRPYYNYYNPYPYYYYPQQSYYAPTSAGTHGGGAGWNNARAVDTANSRENWCAHQLPVTDFSTAKKASCEFEWQGNHYSANGRNEDWALTSARRWACESGAQPEAVLAIQAKCESF